MQSSNARREALLDLIQLRKPVADAVRSLAGYPWDSSGIVELRVTDVENVLAAFEAGAISSDDLEVWAEAIEGRDDIDIEPESESNLKQFLFEVSTPQIHGAFDLDKASYWEVTFGLTTFL